MDDTLTWKNKACTAAKSFPFLSEFQASNQSSAIIGPPAKRHLHVVSLMDW